MHVYGDSRDNAQVVKKPSPFSSYVNARPKNSFSSNEPGGMVDKFFSREPEIPADAFPSHHTTKLILFMHNQIIYNPA